MIIRLSDFGRKGAVEIDSLKQPQEFDLDGNHFKQPIALKLKLEFIGEIVCADFLLKTISAQTCDRCANDFDLLIKTQNQLRFIPFTFSVGRNQDNDDVKFYHPDNPTIDVTQDIHDYILLAIPIKLLCRQDCQGICPECGADLNRSECKCAPTKPDPRWAKLQSLKDTMLSDRLK